MGNSFMSNFHQFFTSMENFLLIFDNFLPKLWNKVCRIIKKFPIMLLPPQWNFSNNFFVKEQKKDFYCCTHKSEEISSLQYDALFEAYMKRNGNAVECLCHSDTSIFFYEKYIFCGKWNQHKKKQSLEKDTMSTDIHKKNVAQVNEISFTFLVNETLLYVN